MKTKGMKHQIAALRKMKGAKIFALFMDQGTGKTWTFLADAERLFAAGEIDAALVLSPKGVHTNWVRREIPAHWDGPIITGVWRTGAGKRYFERLEKTLFRPRERGEPTPMRLLSMNIDGVKTKDGLAFAQRFLRSTKAIIIIDESTRIKNVKSKAWEVCVEELQQLAKYRRIGSGLPITNAPTDIFGQAEFLERGLLGTSSFRAFNAEYSVLLDKDSFMFKKMIQKNPRMAWAQIVATDENGKKMYRNLDKLHKLIQPWSYRILKEECLDLPPKVYKNFYFEMTPAQWKAYDLMDKKLRYEYGDDMDVFTKLTKGIKLQQITSGFAMLKSGELSYVEGDNPRLAALVDWLEDKEGKKVVIWAHFREEIRAIAAVLKKMGRKAVEYHGGVTKDEDRDEAIDRFQDVEGFEPADTFLGHAQAGGIGITITAATDVLYYSCSYNLEFRKQSEDRTHRKGTVGTVTYTDLVADGSIDEDIAEALQVKEGFAAKVLNKPTLLRARSEAI